MSRYSQQSVFLKCKSAYENGRLPHALLFHAPAKLELDGMLKELAALLLQKPLIEDLSQTPDIHFIQSDGNQIKLAQINEILDELKLTSHGAAKLVIISVIESFNLSAANAFLKTLEEPSDNTYFLLITHQLNWVIPTILSRVQVIDMVMSLNEKMQYLKQQYKLTQDDANKALRIARGDIKVIDRIKTDKDFWLTRKLLMMTMLGKTNAIEAAEKLSVSYVDAIYWLTSLVVDGYYLSQSVPFESIANIDQEVFLHKMAQKHTSDHLYGVYQKLLQLKNLHGKHVNINKQLALESMLLQL